eukprot:1508113-Rhodomonas_salina.1
MILSRAFPASAVSTPWSRPTMLVSEPAPRSSITRPRHSVACRCVTGDVRQALSTTERRS